MTKDELKLAFQKAFQMGQDYWYYADHEFESYNKKSDAIRAKFNEMVKETIEEALAQPEQEPVLWMMPDGNTADKWALQFYGGQKGKPLYTTPPAPSPVQPERPWVGLTFEEKQHAIYLSDWKTTYMEAVIEYIEQTLKDKNA